jgi:hypothetical protein
MSDVSLVHLVRRQNGPEALAAFLHAYRAHEAGAGHEIMLACKGYEGPGEAREMLPSIPWARVESYPDTGFDIGTYRRAALDVGAEFVCFLNSWSRPLVDGWLASLVAVAKRGGVGLVGATGSLEGIPGAPFPNYHVRTNAFVIRRELFIELAPVDPTREQCLDFEAGPNSLTRQVQARGLKALTVPRREFRRGEQRRLLVADNRTDDYQRADAERREFLRQLAWGATA